MGQYYKIVNLDKKQYIKPHDFGNGAKLMEFACSSGGVMQALAVLLADGNGRGGGDIHSSDPIVGSWAGDRIVIAGDYADGGKFVPPSDHGKDPPPLYSYASDERDDDTWVNISTAVRALFLAAREEIGGPI